jgi:hypothetical protein
MNSIVEAVPPLNKHQMIVIYTAIVTVFLIMVSPLLSPVISAVIEPYWDAGQCEECHSSFQPFNIIPDSPTGVPEGEEFDYKLIIENPWKHDIRDIQVTIDLTNAPNVVNLESVEDETIIEDFDGDIGAGSQVSGTVEADFGASEILFQMYYVDPLLFTGDLNIEVTGPNGGSWTSDLSDTTEVIHIGQDEIIEEGYGTYSWTITSEASFRAVEYHLASTIIISGGPIIIAEMDDIGSREESTIEFHLGTNGKGDNVISYIVTGEAYHDHSEDHPDTDTYTVDGSSSINVGDEYVYSKPGRSISFSTGLWYVGRIMAFVTTILFLISFMTGGSIHPVKNWLDGKIKNRIKIHCTVSKIVVLAALVHLIVLYAGLYSGTYKGLFLGSTSLILMVVLGATGAFKKKIVKKIGERNWRRIHFWTSVTVLVIVIIHAVMEGTDLAFLRFWE